MVFPHGTKPESVFAKAGVSVRGVDYVGKVLVGKAGECVGKAEERVGKAASSVESVTERVYKAGDESFLESPCGGVECKVAQEGSSLLHKENTVSLYNLLLVCQV